MALAESWIERYGWKLDLPKQCSKEEMKEPRACRTHFKTLDVEGERS